MKFDLPLALATSFLLLAPTQAKPIDGIKDALDGEHIGLLGTDKLQLKSGPCADCASIPQSLWYFQNDLVAVPSSPELVAGFAPNIDHRSDVKAWAQTPAAATLAYPSVTWIGAPQLIEAAAIDAGGAFVTIPGTGQVDFALVPKLSTNLSYADAKTREYFSRRSVRMRGTLEEKDGKQKFVARTVWPADYAIDGAGLAVQPLANRGELSTFVRDPASVPGGAVASRLIWERSPGLGRQLAGKPAMGFMLNGAQGDDDESLGGHFAIATGTFGAKGEWADWAVNNFYNLDSVSEKGIIAATIPMDNYLADLNSGQQYYRPSYMLVAVLKNTRTAVAYQGGVQRTMNHFYRHEFAYRHAADNCAGISLDVMRALGWQLPQRGPTSRVKAIGAYGYISAKEVSLAKGRNIYDYLTEEQTRLYPAVAFEAAGLDLLQLVGAMPGDARTLSPYEQQLKDDIEAIVLVKIAQIPSSRVMGSSPAFSFDEYMSRVPANQADWKIVPVGPRPFPATLRDAATPPVQQSALVPLPIMGIGAIAVVGLWLLFRRRKKSKVV